MKNPTSDDFAIAIVTACREVGEDPIAVAERKHSPKARHYALHALRYIFPDSSPATLADFVGAPGQPKHFWKNSCGNIANPTGHSGYAVHWWDPETYQRVVRAIEADRTRRAVAPKPPADIQPAPPATKWTPAHTVRIAEYATRDREPPPEDDDDPSPIFDRGAFKEKRPAYQAPPTGKAALEQELRQALENTAKMARRE